jgi:hypothetical protein
VCLKTNLKWFPTILKENFNESWNVRYSEENKYNRLVVCDGNLTLSCSPESSVAGI